MRSSRFHLVAAAATAVLGAALAALPAAAQTATLAPASQPAPAPEAKPAPKPAIYTYQEVMVPMRDGVKLQTVIIAPVEPRGPLPILIRRSPYGVPPQAPNHVPSSWKALAEDGYIMVFQNIRGRFKSEGTFSIATDMAVTPGQGTIETRDGYDTVDWLVKNVPNNNGRVGVFGVSYEGLTAAAMLLGPHPALKAVSEQASPSDLWMNDDFHHYGAFRFSYAFEYANIVEAEKDADSHFAFDKWDTYSWYLAAGPLATINDKYFHGKIDAWNQFVEHPNYDAFWKNQAWTTALHSTTVPTLNVAGFWDQEDPWGPWQIWRHEAEKDPKHTDHMVAGPWWHGGWWSPSYTKLGPVPLGGHDVSAEYRANIEAPFFAYWLHGKGKPPEGAATLFETGSNQWRTFAEWPPKAAKPTSLYLHVDGTLSFEAPGAGEAGAHRDYVSDPANPAPYRARPNGAIDPSHDWQLWEMSDQRFVDNRPDVLTFTSAPLDHDLKVTGQVSAQLFASTSGTDSDFVVKLIDVFPEDAEKPTWSEDEGAPAGDYGKIMNGYELPIAMEVRRGRYLKSFEHPSALTPDKPVLWEVPLRDRDHVFLKGHRIMVQVQSTWFPIIDRNPQTFTPSIFTAKASDYVKATQKVYAAPDMASRIILPVEP
jgi:putative CocE/NonD family hydrolase